MSIRKNSERWRHSEQKIYAASEIRLALETATYTWQSGSLCQTCSNHNIIVRYKRINCVRSQWRVPSLTAAAAGKENPFQRAAATERFLSSRLLFVLHSPSCPLTDASGAHPSLNYSPKQGRKMEKAAQLTPVTCAHQNKHSMFSQERNTRAGKQTIACPALR